MVQLFAGQASTPEFIQSGDVRTLDHETRRGTEFARAL
ncbi:uncharacterized protein ANIA_11503 [Aspergillus nidulans FGSC A4]|uniref:Uncharacterized protein n=1 Tax=Emericella nidulans (strain FGSC A4 / ATCC 38163 / CBS 112.46 / NRRL 194 / M139) TaxID=227321 RepID=C8V1U6_EMENI|nr:hypothetical protein [Aspergillus nidulans FGSC A4]CBF69961.1 TPA: hypothetical protein ANIA_11503 [Aspergillus nidulans FGSC A4]